jgi:hypothetical protein
MVSLRIVQNRDHWTAQVPQQITQEHANFLLPNVVEVSW